MTASTLFVLRHAHSSPASAGRSDHSRPLDARGRLEAAAMAQRLANPAHRPDRILCSTALRTRETLAIAGQNFPEIRTDFLDDLYTLGVSAYLEAARQCADAGRVLIVGHNPMISTFVTSLVRQEEAGALTRLEQGLPTAGLAIIDFATSLDRIEPGTGTLRSFIDPSHADGA